jgi:pimeloyl-ACP methyl ester carboxylesterase
MNDFALPETRYALSGDVNIAYQVMGDGPVDIILVPGSISHIEFQHELPGYTPFLRRLSTFARVVTFDKRGQGLSDRISGAPSLEQRIDDVRAIMDTVGSQRATLFGFSEGCAMSAMFAATSPERVSKLVLFGGYARFKDLSDNPEERVLQRVKFWGTGAMIKKGIPSQAENPEAVAQFAKFERLCASPGACKEFSMLNAQIDISSILPAVRVPTLVLHRKDDALAPVECGRDLARRIPEARYIEYSGSDHAFWSDESETLIGDVEEFVTGHRGDLASDLERTLATVLFTDIVDSTTKAAEKGDQTWRRLLDSHDQLAKQIVEKHRGALVTVFWRHLTDPAAPFDVLLHL